MPVHPPANIKEILESLLSVHNQARSKRNLGALRFNAALIKAAHHHAKYMATTQNMTHQQTAAETKAPKDRAQLFGYTPWTTIAENVGYNSSGSEREMMVGWLKSPGHCSNIMNSSVTEVGFYAMIGEDGNCYYCAIFGSRT